MYFYHVYGLQIQSSRYLHGLLPSSSQLAPDLVIYWPSDDAVTPKPSLTWRPLQSFRLRQRKRIRFWEAEQPDGCFLRMKYSLRLGTIECILSPASDKMWLSWSEPMSAENIRTYLLGAILGGVLRRRGILCLHASVVTIAGKGVVLLGKKHAGKSTTAAALMQYGSAVLLSDDMAVLTPNGKGFKVQPGYPGLRLWPSVVAQLFNSEIETLPLVYSDREKRYLFFSERENLQNGFSPHPVPLEAVFLLDERDPNVTAVDIKAMSTQQSLLTMSANTFADYAVFGKKMLVQEFKIITQIVNNVPVRRLKYPAGLDSLPQLCAAIIEGI